MDFLIAWQAMVGEKFLEEDGQNKERHFPHNV